MDTSSIVEGIKNLIPKILESTKTTTWSLGKMISPDNPNLGVIMILIVWVSIVPLIPVLVLIVVIISYKS